MKKKNRNSFLKAELLVNCLPVCVCHSLFCLCRLAHRVHYIVKLSRVARARVLKGVRVFVGSGFLYTRVTKCSVHP